MLEMKSLYEDPVFQEKMSQEEPYTFCCDECGEPIVYGDRYWKIGDECYCEACIDAAERRY